MSNSVEEYIRVGDHVIIDSDMLVTTESMLPLWRSMRNAVAAIRGPVNINLTSTWMSNDMTAVVIECGISNFKNYVKLILNDLSSGWTESVYIKRA